MYYPNNLLYVKRNEGISEKIFRKHQSSHPTAHIYDKEIKRKMFYYIIFL